MFFWNSLAVLMIQWMLAIWFLVPLPFLIQLGHLEVHGKCTVGAWLGEFWALLYYHVRWVQLCSSLNIHSLALPFFGTGMKTDLFQSCGHCWVFQICWHIDCSTSTASSFRIWNSSTGIPSPQLALFVVMLPKALLTSHSRMSGSRWVITPSWSPGSLRSFLDSSVHSCHLLISSASVRSITFLSFFVPLFAWNVPLVSLIFLKRCLVFPILLFPSISLHWSLRKAFLSLLAILWNSAFRWVYLSFSPLLFTYLLFTAICKASSDSHFAFLHFFFLGMVFLPVSCTISWTSIHRSSDTLSDLAPKYISHFHYIIIRDLI